MGDSRPRSYHFDFERREIALLLAGLGVMLVLMFLLGMVVGQRSAARLHTARVESVEICPVPAEGEREEIATALPAEVVEQPQQGGQEQLQVSEETLTFFSTLPDSSESTLAPAEAGSTPAQASGVELAAVSSPVADSVSAGPPEEAETERRQTLEEPPAEVAALEHAQEEGPYSIQVGSFQDRAPAVALAENLRAKGYPAVVRQVDLPGKGVWYRVRVEGYSERAAAAYVARLLQQEENLSALVLTGAE